MTPVPSRSSRPWSHVPAALWALLIFGASSIPSKAFPSYAILTQDKLLHMGVYFVLGLLVYTGITTRTRGQWGAMAWVAFGICVLYGASDEFHQHFVPGRSMDIFDLLADAIGAACAIGLIIALERRAVRRA